MMTWWETVLVWIAVGVLMMVAATVWGAFIVVVGLLFALGVKMIGGL